MQLPYPPFPLRKLDKLVLKSFVGPFIVTFGIAIFVLLMQILWVYLDDIAGKGLGFFVIIELLAYKCVGLVPLALPLALLISTVMVLGSLAEHYELSSFKSAGVGLLRVMRPLIVIGVISAGISFACNDYLIPAANLQFGSRMYSIQQKKPTLNMEPGVFNEDFSQFAIRLGERDANGRDIADVLIYDHTKETTGELAQIIAKDGEMYSSGGGRYFVMELNDGHQYVEQRPGGRSGGAPFVRTDFSSYTKVWDLGDFDLKIYQSSLFKTNRSMLSTWQLQEGVDSIELDIAQRKQDISNHLVSYLPKLRKDTITYRRELELTGQTRYSAEAQQSLDSMATDSANLNERRVAENLGVAASSSSYVAGGRDTTEQEADPRLARRKRDLQRQAREHPLVVAAGEWSGVPALFEALDAAARVRVYSRAQSNVRSVRSQAQSVLRILPGIMESKVKHIYDKHAKYSMALVCVIFVFIGAPMGAIVRKGGFGYPILVSIIFFVIFVILTIFCRKLAESFVVTGAVAGWMPCIVLFPVSLWITRSAMNDAKLVQLDKVKGAFRRARGGLGAAKRRLLRQELEGTPGA